MSRKAQKIIADNLLKIEGQWCFGCTANCEFKKPPRWNGNHMGSLDGLEEFIKNVDSVVEKAISILRKELGTEDVESAISK